MARNEETLTPQEIMQRAVAAVNNVSGMNPVAKAEATVALADAASRLHAANQAEVENLLKVVQGTGFTVEQRMKASKKVATLLGLD